MEIRLDNQLHLLPIQQRAQSSDPKSIIEYSENMVNNPNIRLFLIKFG